MYIFCFPLFFLFFIAFIYNAFQEKLGIKNSNLSLKKSIESQDFVPKKKNILVKRLVFPLRFIDKKFE